MKGPPIETISLDVEFDATDQLAQPAQYPTAVNMGIYPQLSALEVLVYPPSSLVIANTILAATGTIEIIPPMGPFTVFIWGARRVVPVRLHRLPDNRGSLRHEFEPDPREGLARHAGDDVRRL